MPRTTTQSFSMCGLRIDGTSDAGSSDFCVVSQFRKLGIQHEIQIFHFGGHHVFAGHWLLRHSAVPKSGRRKCIGDDACAAGLLQLSWGGWQCDQSEFPQPGRPTAGLLHSANEGVQEPQPARPGRLRIHVGVKPEFDRRPNQGLGGLLRSTVASGSGPGRRYGPASARSSYLSNGVGRKKHSSLRRLPWPAGTR